MIERKRISASDLDLYFALEEGPYLDLKHSDIAPAKLSKSISAFCNAAGGEIVIGIGEKKDGDKKRYWAGYADMEGANAVFQVIEAMLPLGNHYKATFLNLDSNPGVLLHLVLIKAPGIICASDGRAYIRKNAQNLPVDSPEALRRLELDKGITSFEDNAAQVHHEAITNSLTTLNFMLHSLPRAEPEDWLKKQNLLTNGSPTVAGVMLFADEPQAILPKRSAIKVYRYQTKDSGTRESLAFTPPIHRGMHL